jgi:hypothetical protein
MSSQTQASEQRSPCRVGVWTGLDVTPGYFKDSGARGCKTIQGGKTRGVNVKKTSKAHETTLRPQTRKVALAGPSRPAISMRIHITYCDE